MAKAPKTKAEKVGDGAAVPAVVKPLANLIQMPEIKGRFIECHALISFPASALVRDDTGRPKTMMMGGVQRGRISSQAYKRALRCHPGFIEGLGGRERMGSRSVLLVDEIERALLAENIDREKVATAAAAVAATFGGSADKENKSKSQLGNRRHGAAVFLDPSEIQGAIAAAREISLGKIKEDEIPDLIADHVGSVDVALFGRMFAGRGERRMTAAMQVMHPLTIHRVLVENDYITGLDDWQGSASGHKEAIYIGSRGFYSGVFLSYISIDFVQLLHNLGGDLDLAKRALFNVLLHFPVVSPSGGRSSYGSFARAGFMRVERVETPRPLSQAFLRPASSDDYMREGIDRLREMANEFIRAYDDQPLVLAEYDSLAKTGSIREIAETITNSF